MSAPVAAVTRRVATEFLGAMLLAAIVVGSGIAATGLSSDVGVQLLINAVSTALGLFVLITVLGPISGAHFNPAVSLVDLVLGHRSAREVGAYIAAQIAGCIAGAMLANVMFDAAAASISTTDRVTPGHLVAEVVATAGLILAIFALVRSGRAHLAATVVAAYIGSAYFFTSSTSFANPAITIGRIFSDSFAGIAPSSAPWFIAAQLAGAVLGLALVRWLLPVQLAEPEPEPVLKPEPEPEPAPVRIEATEAAPSTTTS
ncbi:aquaporin [Agromyces albus]|uniref:Aquaporin family protein n=1 Tax=Agromyces albus TaxID=205332 RepID=A0A4V1QXZ9_9MICO|nr:MIP/aquaporin family protein [Agromyces albus]RXZ71416.1 aquaporin family protein [Agromyces albus]